MKVSLFDLLLIYETEVKKNVRNKKKTANDLGIKSTVIELPENTTEEELLVHIEKLNKDEDVTGILVQMPLPKHINREHVVCPIDAKKDVDCFNPENVGKLAIGAKPYFNPVTPQGILILLDYYKVPIEGKHVVVIGRSNIVGKPMAQMLLQRNEKTYILLYHLYLYQYQHNLPKAYQQMLDLDKDDIQKHLFDILWCYLFFGCYKTVGIYQVQKKFHYKFLFLTFLRFYHHIVD